MSLSDTQDVMDRYFAAMGQGEDFSRFFVESMTWLVVSSGQLISGPANVRDYVVELHDKMAGGEAREMVVADGHAYLEGFSFNPSPERPDGLSYCIAYDVGDDQILAARCFGNVGLLVPTRAGAR